MLPIKSALAHNGINLGAYVFRLLYCDITPVNHFCGNKQMLMQFCYIIFAMNEVNMFLYLSSFVTPKIMSVTVYAGESAGLKGIQPFLPAAAQ